MMPGAALGAAGTVAGIAGSGINVYSLSHVLIEVSALYQAVYQ